MKDIKDDAQLVLTAAAGCGIGGFVSTCALEIVTLVKDLNNAIDDVLAGAKGKTFQDVLSLAKFVMNGCKDASFGGVVKGGDKNILLDYDFE